MRRTLLFATIFWGLALGMLALDWAALDAA